MEVSQTSEAQLLITGAGGDQPLIMSAEDAAQLLAQAGLQLADIGDSERIIIGEAHHNQQELIDSNGVVTAESLLAASGIDIGSEVSGEINDDGTVLYIDPNDPQAAALLQQAGLTLAEDGTVQAIEDGSAKMVYENGGSMSQQDFFLAAHQDQQHQDEMSNVAHEQKVPEYATQDQKEPEYVDPNEFLDASGMMGQVVPTTVDEATTLATLATAAQASPAIATSAPGMSASVSRPQTTSQPASSIQVGPDQQQVFYSVTGEDGKTQQYMMLCPKDMDQNTLIQTLVRQISSDPTSRGKKTIRITQQKKPPSKPLRAPPAPKVMAIPRAQKAATAPSTAPQMMTVSRQQLQQLQQQQQQFQQQQILQQAIAQSALETNQSFEALQPDPVLNQHQQFLSSTESLLELSNKTETPVFIRCNYCSDYSSTLNGDTWEGILNHILPVCKEELQTTFYGDLAKHFIRSIRIQVNGKQVVCTKTDTGVEQNTPQCEVILTHSLVCRKTKREFVINRPDASFIANLAKHIRMTQPGQGGRGNSLLCIFCNCPFTYEDYLRHIQPHISAIIATLSCFAGAYCTSSYQQLRATSICIACQEPESADLRFLPCTKFSTEYHCLSKLQFAIECFRENFGDNGFMRLTTNHLAKCTVCKNPQQVYCAVFQITSTSSDELGVQQNIDSQLCICINCQKQFINIVMKEQGFDEKMKQYQLRNMEQLCSCLRIILGQVKNICHDKKTLIYAVHENTSNANSTVHTIKGADISELTPITKMMALPETEIASSPVKAFFVCDLCMFTVDLTSLIATPSNRQKNEMLLSVMLEHIVPHTDSLMTLITSAALNKTFSLKFELALNVSEQPATGQRKILISLKKKLHSKLGSGAELVLDKDEETTINNIRSAIKSERKSYVTVRGPRAGSGGDNPELPPTLTTTTTASNSLQLEISKFIEKHRTHFSTWSQSGCNISLLNSYMECRLCSKFCFPDFRLVSAAIKMCESCVETVLTLCLPTEPECLEIPEECLALKEERSIGHRLVLATDQKKWLSLDGVIIIKKTVEEFEHCRFSDSSTAFSDGIRQHLLAVLKTCQNDDDIMSAVTGFCITEDFLQPSNSNIDSETAAALAALQQQVGVPIQQKEEKRSGKDRQIEVKILSRRPPNSTKKTPIPIRFGTKIVGPNIKRIIKNGTVIDLGSPNVSISSAPSTSGSPAHAKIIYLNAAKNNKDNSSQEESVSAIKSFLEATSPQIKATTIIDGREVRVPAGIKITSAGRGVVNIRAIADSRSSMSSSRVPVMTSQTSMSKFGNVGSVRGMKGVSMVTLTAGGIIKKVSEPKSSLSDTDDLDEGDSDDLFDDEFDDFEVVRPARHALHHGHRKRGRPPRNKNEDGDYRPTGSALKAKPKRIPIKKKAKAAEASMAMAMAMSSPSAADESLQNDSADANDASLNDSANSASGDNPRSKRARKEKKIFDL